jgi:hypothetical protein
VLCSDFTLHVHSAVSPGNTRVLLGQTPTKRSVFVSYHHGGDRVYYNAFSQLFADNYEVIQTTQWNEIDSNDPEYVIRRTREDFITGSSCTVVLCGAETPQRKFVDWEIKATLDKEHVLIGINLPTNPRLLNGNVIVPNRLFDNIQSGYAIWTNWQAVTQNPALLTKLVEQANARSKALIRNQRELRTRNG